MKKTKDEEASPSSRSMLNQKTGGILDKKTNEDFNNEHPDHADPNLKKEIPRYSVKIRQAVQIKDKLY